MKGNSKQQHVMVVSYADNDIFGGLVRAYKDKTNTFHNDINGTYLTDKACE